MTEEEYQLILALAKKIPDDDQDFLNIKKTIGDEDPMIAKLAVAYARRWREAHPEGFGPEPTFSRRERRAQRARYKRV